VGGGVVAGRGLFVWRGWVGWARCGWSGVGLLGGVGGGGAVGVGGWVFWGVCEVLGGVFWVGGGGIDPSS